MSTTPHEEWREDADGTPHLSYFAESTSFVWSGSAERPIQVCDGAAGEPVTDTIDPFDVPAFDGMLSMNLPLILRTFREVCDQYLREREAR